MAKSTYYVTVAQGELLQDPTALNYDFVIEADEDEFDKLQELFEDTAEAEQRTAGTSLIPYLRDAAEDNEFYDSQLMEIYRMLHQLGTPETRKHIESMGILSDLQS
ncbi:hypothetical protein [Paenibacillus senegalensis]|uniref:hypothetical protein n=1 Tax=Paenibacillus senegalensis TaxID=1465766 RepID=UPI0002892A26|nr:hypothetical protein [Paenibacillus senegalensis]